MPRKTTIVYDEAGGVIHIGFWHNLIYYIFMLLLYGTPVVALILCFN